MHNLLCNGGTLKTFVVARKKCIAPKEGVSSAYRPGYAVREFRDDSGGSYWYVVTALEVMRTNKR